jgi:hypothetical protein
MLGVTLGMKLRNAATRADTTVFIPHLIPKSIETDR